MRSWDIFERIYSSHWFLTSYNGIGFVFDFPKIGGGKLISHVMYIMENQMCRYIFDRAEFDKAAHFTANRLINDDKWRNGVYKKINKYSKAYYSAGEKLRKLSLQKLSDKQLTGQIKKIILLQHYHQVYSVLANGVVLDGRNHLSNKIRDELKRDIDQPKNFESYWTLLTQPTKMSLRQKKDYEMAKLAKQLRHRSAPDVEFQLKLLHKKYCWLDYNNMGPPATITQFKKELRNSSKHNKNRNLPMRLAKLSEQQKKLMHRLKFSPRSKFLVRLAQTVIWQKGYRKDMQYHGFYCYENLFKELARKNGIKDWQTFSFLFPWEVAGFIEKGEPSLKELENRRLFSVFIVRRRGLKVLSGLKAKVFVKRLGSLENTPSIKELSGQCAYEGKVKGLVRIIQVPEDMIKMKKGDILVSQATSPDLLPAMKKAAAIVTNTGGLICHAAITSRELKIPCIVGTAKATLVFKDGDLVEVNANKGIVRKVK